MTSFPSFICTQNEKKDRVTQINPLLQQSTNKKRKENKANPNFYTKIVFHLQDNSDEMTAPEHEHQY